MGELKARVNIAKGNVQTNVIRTMPADLVASFWTHANLEGIHQAGASTLLETCAT